MDKLLNKYSPVYLQNRTPVHRDGFTIPKSYLTDTFEHTYNENDPMEELTQRQRKTLSNWETDKPLFESDLPRRHALYNAGLLNVRYNGSRGEEVRPEHAEMFFGEFNGTKDPYINFSESLKDDAKRIERSKAADMRVDSAGDYIPDSAMPEWVTAARQRDLNYTEMRKRLQFDDGRVGANARRGVDETDLRTARLNTDAEVIDSLLIDAATFDKQKKVSNEQGSSHIYSQQDHRQPVNVSQFSMLKSQAIKEGKMASVVQANTLEDNRLAVGNSREQFVGASKHFNPQLVGDAISALINGVEDRLKPREQMRVVQRRNREERDGNMAEMTTNGFDFADKTRETMAVRADRIDPATASKIGQANSKLDTKIPDHLMEKVISAQKRGRLQGISNSEAAALVVTTSAKKVGGEMNPEIVGKAIKSMSSRGTFDKGLGKTYGNSRDSDNLYKDEIATANYKSLPVVDKISQTINKEADMSWFESIHTFTNKSNQINAEPILQAEMEEDTRRTGDNKSVFNVSSGRKFKFGDIREKYGDTNMIAPIKENTAINQPRSYSVQKNMSTYTVQEKNMNE